MSGRAAAVALDRLLSLHGSVEVINALASAESVTGHLDVAQLSALADAVQAHARRVYDESRELVRPDLAWVYYVENESGDIKIGYSGDFARRRRALVREHGPIRTLGLERGDRVLESRRHAQFSDLNLRGEWFSPGPALTAHIALLDPSPA